MGKKRIVKKTGTGGTMDREAKTRALSKVSKKRVEKAILSVKSTYNNTLVSLTDTKGNVIYWSSSGSLGFKGAKKGTPFAAAKAGELIGEKAKIIGVKEIDAIVNGVGAGRESAIRAFISKGVKLNSIKDVTPIPHNGPKPPKTRRV